MTKYTYLLELEFLKLIVITIADVYSSSMVLIGLVGSKYSGKSTVASHLVTHYNFVELAFATPLKSVCMEVFGFTRNQVYGSMSHKETVDPYWGISPRQALQDVGTLFRDLYKVKPQYQQVWIRSLERSLCKLDSTWNVVISDVRYQDEANMIKKRGGVLIGIYRSNLLNTDQHESENQDIKVNIVIRNDGTIEDLKHKVDEVISKLNNQ